MSIVAKFGGSILKDDRAYEDVALELLVLKARHGKVYAIVSAQYGETQRLIHEIAGNEREALEIALLGQTINSKFDIPKVSKTLIQGELDSVDRLIEILGDYAVGVKQTESYPIIARGSYLYGHLLLPESRLKAKELQHSAPIEIISGFGALDINGNVVLLGRNASDYIAAIYACLYYANKIIFYKDVGGIYDKNRRKLEVITRQEFLNLGNLQVLDPRVLDIYGGEVIVKGLYDLGNVHITFPSITRQSNLIISGESSIRIPESGTIIKGLPEPI